MICACGPDQHWEARDVTIVAYLTKGLWDQKSNLVTVHVAITMRTMRPGNSETKQPQSEN